ncbi:MAG: hypothetical protein AAF387_07155 [Pseudomonadota bacterium]
MANIGLIWELGADLGHITRFALVADALAKRGHQCVMVLRDTTRMQAISSSLPSVPYLQAPISHRRPTGLPPALNFTETLLSIGFSDAETLTGLVSAWRNCFAQIRPDLLVFDHAPIAQLAASDLPCAQAILANTFAIPPGDTFPSYRFWLDEPDTKKRMATSYSHCLSNAKE